MAKTSELAGSALDWAVASAEGRLNDCEIHANTVLYGRITVGFVQYHPTQDWAQGGPIIEREKINLERWHTDKLWHSCMNERLQYDEQGEFIYGSDFHLSGPTPLIAAMRCYVASKLGDNVEIPQELM